MEWKGIKDHYSRRSQVMLPSNNVWSLSGLFSHSIMKTILALLRSQLNWRMMRVHSFLISRTFSSKASDTVDYSIQLDNVSSTGSHDIATPWFSSYFSSCFSAVSPVDFSFIALSFSFETQSDLWLFYILQSQCQISFQHLLIIFY